MLQRLLRTERSRAFRPIDKETTQMNSPAERVMGIGGFFFRSREPRQLAQWYQLYLGIEHAMVEQLCKAGIEVKVDPERYPNGRFGRLHDPQGNPIEMWEQAGA